MKTNQILGQSDVNNTRIISVIHAPLLDAKITEPNAFVRALTTQEKTGHKTVEGVELVWDEIPEWFDPEEQMPLRSKGLQTYIAQFLELLAPDRRATLFEQGEILASILTSQERDAALKVLTDGAEDERVFADDPLIVMGREVMAVSGSKVSLRLIPCVHVYDAARRLGIINLLKEKDSFHKSRPDREGGAFAGWDNFPSRVEPRTDLPAAYSDLSINLKAPQQVWTLEELVGEISRQRGPFIKIDTKLKKIKFFVSNGKWNLRQLLRFIDIVVGSQIRSLGDTLFMETSPMHTRIGLERFSQQEEAQKFQRVIKNLEEYFHIRTTSQSTMPFDLEIFKTTKPIPAETLNRECRDAILHATQLPLNLADIKIRGVMFLSVGCRVPEGSTIENTGFSIGTDLTSISPPPPLSPPKDLIFRYDPKRALQEYGAILTY